MFNHDNYVQLASQTHNLCSQSLVHMWQGKAKYSFRGGQVNGRHAQHAFCGFQFSRSVCWSIPKQRPTCAYPNLALICCYLDLAPKTHWDFRFYCKVRCPQKEGEKSWSQYSSIRIKYVQIHRIYFIFQILLLGTLIWSICLAWKGEKRIVRVTRRHGSNQVEVYTEFVSSTTSLMC